MSWQAYVDTSLCGSGAVTHGAIASIAGDSIWAKSDGFEISNEELKTIASIVTRDKDAVEKGFTDGVWVSGNRYSLVAAPDDLADAVYCRRADSADVDEKKMGIAISKSQQTIVIARHDHKSSRSQATVATLGLVDFLVKAGY